MPLRRTIEGGLPDSPPKALRTSYPDIGDILARKARGRLERARLSFGEKLDVLDKLRSNVAPIVRARQARVKVQRENSRKAIDVAEQAEVARRSATTQE